MTTCTINTDTDKLILPNNSDTVTPSKPSANVVQASLRSGAYQIVCECTRHQISFHFDELSETYFVIFGHGITISNFTGNQIQHISDFFGFMTYSKPKEA